MNRSLIIFMLLACIGLVDCAQSKDSALEPVPPEVITRLEQSIETLQTGMTETQALAHIDFESIQKYSRFGTAGGPDTNYRTHYPLGNSGTLTLIHNREGLKQIIFLNRKTNKFTKSKPLQPT